MTELDPLVERFILRQEEKGRIIQLDLIVEEILEFSHPEVEYVIGRLSLSIRGTRPSE